MALSGGVQRAKRGLVHQDYPVCRVCKRTVNRNGGRVETARNE